MTKFIVISAQYWRHLLNTISWSILTASYTKNRQIYLILSLKIWDPEDRGETDWGERDAGRAERRCQHWFQGGEEKEKERSSRKIRLEYIQIFYSCIVRLNSLFMYPVIQIH